MVTSTPSENYFSNSMNFRIKMNHSDLDFSRPVNFLEGGHLTEIWSEAICFMKHPVEVTRFDLT
jgi:hypothetical protein